MRFRWLATAAPPAEGDPDDLLTIADITDYTGLKRGTINADISRRPVGRPDDTGHDVKRWKRSTVDDIMKNRRGYRRADKGEQRG